MNAILSTCNSLSTTHLLRRSLVISLVEIFEILERQSLLLKQNAQLLTSKGASFAETLENSINDPATMYIVLELANDPFVAKIIAEKQSLSQKVKALTEPSCQLTSSFTDKSFIENIQLSLLVKKAVEVDSIPLDELANALGCTASGSAGQKAVQKLVMRSIQLNLIKATIDKQSNRVYFL